MLATISLSGTLSNLREYDSFDSLCSLRAGVWGGVRDQGSVTTDPNTRYCANLGHKQDVESGLIYMRARFYDAGTGRFISEDPARDGTNWFVYCNNDPVNWVDRTGATYEAEMADLMLQFANIIRGIGSFASNAYRIGEIRVLMTAMSTYVGLELSDMLRHFESASFLAASGSVEGARIERALGAKARANALVGRIYLGQMELGIVAILLEVF